MKKLDILILKSFIGPFILTTLVSTFILLTQYMLKYFDDFVGKDLGPEVFTELILYFSLNMMPVAIPLGVLLSSLMTFGNLGEHFELTAIKSAGISLIRALAPIGVFVFFLTIGAFFFNNNIVPAANLKAYSLLYDIKNTKPALDIRAGQFYDGIDGYSIKAREKFPDNQTLKDVIIYDHTQPTKQGNKTVIMADSAIMYTVYNDRYLRFELYKGNYYDENPKGPRRKRLNSRYIRNSFEKMEMMFSLASFDLKQTKEELFQNNRQMKNISELSTHIDSLKLRINESTNNLAYSALAYYKYHFREELLTLRDSIETQVKLENERKRKAKQEEERRLEKSDSLRKRDSLQIVPPVNTKAGSHVKASILDLSFLQTGQKPKKSPTIKRQDTVSVKATKGAMIDVKGAIKESRSKKPIDKYLIPQEKGDSSEVIIEKDPDNAVDTANINKESKEDQDTLPEKKRDRNTSDIFGIKLDTAIVMQTKDSIDAYFVKYKYKKGEVVANALSKVKNIHNSVKAVNRRIRSDKKNIDKYSVEKYKKYSQAFACIVMFLIGAPLGSIIKKGGLGVPVIVSIVFFIIYYVFTITSEKWAKEGLVEPMFAVWYANIFLLPFGFYFLSRAKVDARLFELDSYRIWFEKRFRKRKI
ncbi:MAG: LptF/LptG family permease [Cyclobacteriaceae bacterium]